MATEQMLHLNYDRDDDFHNAGGQAYISGDEAEEVAIVLGPHCKDRAAFIVAACNCHDELLANLKLLATWMRRTSVMNRIGEVGKMLTGAEAAIANAEKQ